MDQTQNLITTLQTWFFNLVVIFLILAGLTLLLYALLIWWRNRHREEQALQYVLLQVAVPFDNEIKIDAAEQMFASLFAIKKGGFLKFLKLQPHLSFEIVAKHEDIRFYVSVPTQLKDMVEKQINGAYPDAEILEVPEYNIFSENGRVAFAELELKESAYRPIKLYKDLPTDSLSSLTTALAKMDEGEGAAVQILITPSESQWQSAGRNFIASIKKA